MAGQIKLHLLMWILLPIIMANIETSAAEKYCTFYKNHADYIEIDDMDTGLIQADNKTVICTNEEETCAAVWHNETIDGVVQIEMMFQGCFNEQWAISCEEGCRAVDAPAQLKEGNKTVHYCCCTTSMCNANVSDVYVPTLHPPFVPGVPEPPVPSKTNNKRTIIMAILPIFCLSIVMVSIFLICRLRLMAYKESLSELPSIESGNLEPTFDLDQMKLFNLVGQGRYCNCYRGTLSEQEVAVKLFAGSSRNCFLNEREIYSIGTLDHANVLKFYGTAERLGEDGWMEYLLIVEYISGGSLMGYLKDNVFDWFGMCRLAQTTAAGIAYIHQEIKNGDVVKPAIVHRDINSRNILVRPNGACVIGDLGFAMKVSGSRLVGEDDDTSSLTDVGTVRYMSPEALEGAVNLRDCESALKQVDIYALGLVIWEISNRCSDLFPAGVPPYMLPYEAEVGQRPSYEDMQLLVSVNKTRPKFPDAWKENNQALRSLKEIMDDSWDHDAEARLTALCIEERIIELMVMWDKNKVVHSTVNPTQTDIVRNGGSQSSMDSTDSAVKIRPNGQIVRREMPSSRVPGVTQSVSEEADVSSGSRSVPLEKNERQAFSPETCSTTISTHSDINLMDFTFSQPDPKNLHHSDESIERFTTDLKYAPRVGGNEALAEMFSYSESISPSHSDVNTAQTSDMYDNTGYNCSNRPRQQFYRTGNILPENMTINQARPLSQSGKSDTNKHREQQQCAQARPHEHTNEGASVANGMNSASNTPSRSFRNSPVSMDNSTDEPEEIIHGSPKPRPSYLPVVPQVQNGTKKKLVAVYVPGSGPTTKIQTGIAKLDMTNGRCHPVRVATNGNSLTRCPNTGSLPSVSPITGEHDSNGNLQADNENGTALSHEDRILSYSDAQLANKDEQRYSLDLDRALRCYAARHDNGKRKATPFRIKQSKMAVHDMESENANQKMMPPLLYNSHEMHPSSRVPNGQFCQIDQQDKLHSQSSNTSGGVSKVPYNRLGEASGGQSESSESSEPLLTNDSRACDPLISNIGKYKVSCL
ncbi:uncharacterized protein [Antedon mediterranea]|uniref:uncharacterized protein n=1 Tax=Antedon mediterranea TaxID=105859 RepID=UPI003AF5DFAA